MWVQPFELRLPKWSAPSVASRAAAAASSQKRQLWLTERIAVSGVSPALHVMDGRPLETNTQHWYCWPFPHLIEAGVFIVPSALQNCVDMKKWFSLCSLLQKKSNYRSGTMAIVVCVLLLVSWLPFAQFVPNVSGSRALVWVFAGVHVLECRTAAAQGTDRVSEILFSWSESFATPVKPAILSMRREKKADRWSSCP